MIFSEERATSDPPLDRIESPDVVLPLPSAEPLSADTPPDVLPSGTIASSKEGVAEFKTDVKESLPEGGAGPSTVSSSPKPPPRSSSSGRIQTLHTRSETPPQSPGFSIPKDKNNPYPQPPLNRKPSLEGKKSPTSSPASLEVSELLTERSTSPSSLSSEAPQTPRVQSPQVIFPPLDVQALFANTPADVLLTGTIALPKEGKAESKRDTDETPDKGGAMSWSDSSPSPPRPPPRSSSRDRTRILKPLQSPPVPSTSGKTKLLDALSILKDKMCSDLLLPLELNPSPEGKRSSSPGRVELLSSSNPLFEGATPSSAVTLDTPKPSGLCSLQPEAGLLGSPERSLQALGSDSSPQRSPAHVTTRVTLYGTPPESQPGSSEEQSVKVIPNVQSQIPTVDLPTQSTLTQSILAPQSKSAFDSSQCTPELLLTRHEKAAAPTPVLKPKPPQKGEKSLRSSPGCTELFSTSPSAGSTLPMTGESPSAMPKKLEPAHEATTVFDLATSSLAEGGQSGKNHGDLDPQSTTWSSSEPKTISSLHTDQQKQLDPPNVARLPTHPFSERSGAASKSETDGRSLSDSSLDPEIGAGIASPFDTPSHGLSADDPFFGDVFPSISKKLSSGNAKLASNPLLDVELTGEWHDDDDDYEEDLWKTDSESEIDATKITMLAPQNTDLEELEVYEELLRCHAELDKAPCSDIDGFKLGRQQLRLLKKQNVILDGLAIGRLQPVVVGQVRVFLRLPSRRVKVAVDVSRWDFKEDCFKAPIGLQAFLHFVSTDNVTRAYRFELMFRNSDLKMDEKVRFSVRLIVDGSATDFCDDNAGSDGTPGSGYVLVTRPSIETHTAWLTGYF